MYVENGIKQYNSVPYCMPYPTRLYYSCYDLRMLEDVTLGQAKGSIVKNVRVQS